MLLELYFDDYDRPPWTQNVEVESVEEARRVVSRYERGDRDFRGASLYETKEIEFELD